MRSLWQSTEIPHFSALDGNTKTDVLVIGGGLAGILTAYALQQKGIRCILIEKDRICDGNTGRTTAKITAQHGLVYQRIWKTYGMEAAQQYYKINTMALESYAKLCRTVDCGFERKDSYVYSMRNRQALETEAEVLQKCGCPVELCTDTPLPLRTAGAVKMPRQAQFDPVQFVRGIADGLSVYEHTQALSMDGNTVITNRGKIKAESIVCATHFPIFNKHGAYWLKMYQHRSYVLALENAPYMDGMFVDEREDGFSFRYHNGLLLLGGAGNRTGNPCGGWDRLRDFAQRKCPEAVEKYHWAAQDCMTADGIPYIGQYSRTTPNLFVATGFNKWGMTSSMVAAMLLTDGVQGRPNAFADLFSPSRSILHKQILVNGYESLKGFNPFAKKVCPHMGCNLHWNKAEHSWDCPCHGSRLTNDGEILDNPAN